MFKVAVAPVLICALLLPSGAGAHSVNGGPKSTRNQRGWGVSASVTCHRNSANARMCDRLLGPLETVAVNMNIQQDNPTPGIVFTATYTATAPALPPGAGLRPYGRVCAFGLPANRLRFIRGPFDTTTTCHVTAHGRMILRAGVASRLSKTPDFWIIEETATVPGATVHQIGDPLGANAYPADTRIPVRWRDGFTVRDANQTLGILGIPGFPMQAVPLPGGVSASMTVMNVPLVGGSGVTEPAVGRGPTAAQTVPCHTVILEGGLVCYPPRSQAVAEAQLAVRSVNPVGIIEAATHLRLAQLRVFFGFQVHGNRGVNLLYGFGQVCWSSEFTCATRYLVVGEAPGPSPVSGPRMVRDGTTTRLGAPIRYGPWKFLAPVPGRNLVLTVYGPFSRAVVHGLGTRILQAAH